MAFQLASLFVDISARTGGINAALAGLHSNLMGLGGPGQAASGMINGLTAKVMGLHAAIGSIGIMAGVALAGAMAAGLAHCAMETGHLYEAVAKVEQTFGSASGKILALADEMATKFGVVKTQLLDIAASFGLMLQGSGMGREVSAEMSGALSTMAVDVSRFFDIPMQEAIMRIQSGLAGEMEAVRRFGVDLSESNVKRQGAAMGFGAGEYDQKTKQLIRLKIMFQDLAPAAGAAERESGGIVALWEKFQGNLTNLSAVLGERVVPIAAVFLQVANGILDVWISIEKAINQALKAVLSFASGIPGISEFFGFDPSKAERLKEVDAKRDKALKSKEADEELARLAGKKEPKGWMGGVGENWKHTQEAIFGGGKGDVAKKTLDSSKAIEKLLDEIRTSIKSKKGDLDKLGP